MIKYINFYLITYFKLIEEKIDLFIQISTLLQPELQEK